MINDNNILVVYLETFRHKIRSFRKKVAEPCYENITNGLKFLGKNGWCCVNENVINLFKNEDPDFLGPAYIQDLGIRAANSCLEIDNSLMAHFTDDKITKINQLSIKYLSDEDSVKMNIAIQNYNNSFYMNAALLLVGLIDSQSIKLCLREEKKEETININQGWQAYKNAHDLCYKNIFFNETFEHKQKDEKREESFNNYINKVIANKDFHSNPFFYIRYTAMLLFVSSF